MDQGVRETVPEACLTPSALGASVGAAERGMQGPRCQHENREGRRFCADCAGPLAVACPACGFANEPGEKYCGGCAAPFAAARRPVEPSLASPQSYTPRHLAQKILTSKSALE